MELLVSGLRKDKRKEYKHRYMFSVTFIGESDQVTTFGWRYFTNTHELLKPKFGASPSVTVSVSQDMIDKIKASVELQIRTSATPEALGGIYRVLRETREQMDSWEEVFDLFKSELKELEEKDTVTLNHSIALLASACLARLEEDHFNA